MTAAAKPEPPPGVLPALAAPPTGDHYDQMMARLMRRLDQHRDVMMRDSGVAVDAPLVSPRATAGSSGRI